MSEYKWLNKISRSFLGEDYLLKHQTAEQRIDEICANAARILGKSWFESKFKEYVKRGWYSFSSPVWSNFGTDRGLPISCFGSHISDNMDSILYTQAEVGMMSKLGGGCSGYFGEVRPRGAPIRNNGYSSGSVHFMRLFDNIIHVISQGSTRRGNFAAYLPIDHSDINEFLQIRNEGFPIQELLTGVCISDAWMESMIAGDLHKRKVWAKVIEHRMHTGFPYLFFTDNVNRGTVDVYKDLNLPINHSNMCVIGSERVVSDRGLKTAHELYLEGGELKLFDNNKVVLASPMQLIEKNTDVYKVTLDNGMTHTITDYHKVLVRVKDNPVATKDIACKDLKVGDKIAVQTNKGLFGQADYSDEAYLLGLYHGDGTQTDKQVMIDVWENDFDLINEIQEKYNRICIKYNTQFCDKNNRTYPISQFVDCHPSQNGVKKKRLAGIALKKIGFAKNLIPNWLWTASEKTHWAYVKGLFNTDGTIHVNNSTGNPVQLALANVNREFLQQVQIILSNLGMQSTIRILRKSGKNLLPDGKGGSKLYDIQTCYRLIIGNKNDVLEFNKNTNFSNRKKQVIEDRSYRDNTKKFRDVVQIEYVGKEDVYCCKVNSEEHHWICNGVITHNCTEIFLPDNDEEAFVCDLGSMNILYYDEWKDTDAVEMKVYFLDAVMSEFIEKGKSHRFMQRPIRFAERHRALGLGWLGWHSYLQSKMIPFESMEAKLKNMEIAKNIYNKAYAASVELAKEYGEPEILKGYGRRNTTLLAIAPTKSSSFILGQVSEGIEPHRTNYYIKDLAKGKFSIRNPYLEELLVGKGMSTSAVWDSILKNGGSVQHLDFLTDHEKAVFKTFSEISMKEVIIQAAQRQKYIDQGQSINLMIHPSTPVKDINKLMIEAWRMGVKSLYYQYSVNAAQQFTNNLLTCASCEA
jgi:ribonucleoside-diphosphate reductase alpha chain